MIAAENAFLMKRTNYVFIPACTTVSLLDLHYSLKIYVNSIFFSVTLCSQSELLDLSFGCKVFLLPFLYWSVYNWGLLLNFSQFFCSKFYLVTYLSVLFLFIICFSLFCLLLNKHASFNYQAFLKNLFFPWGTQNNMWNFRSLRRCF